MVQIVQKPSLAEPYLIPDRIRYQDILSAYITVSDALAMKDEKIYCSG